MVGSNIEISCLHVSSISVQAQMVIIEQMAEIYHRALQCDRATSRIYCERAKEADIVAYNFYELQLALTDPRYSVWTAMDKATNMVLGFITLRDPSQKNHHQKRHRWKLKLKLKARILYKLALKHGRVFHRKNLAKHRLQTMLSEKSLVICHFAVSPEHQHRGLGTQLLELLLKDVYNRRKNQENALIQVVSSKNALAIYLAHGFEVHDQLEDSKNGVFIYKLRNLVRKGLTDDITEAVSQGVIRK